MAPIRLTKFAPASHHTARGSNRSEAQAGGVVLIYKGIVNTLLLPAGSAKLNPSELASRLTAPVLAS